MFKRINVDTWARKEYFEHYRQVPCSYSMTVKLDITNYTVFHDDTQTFSLLWTEFSQDWKVFLASYEADKNIYGKKQGFCDKESI